jgi:hypothetical protein
MPHLQNTNYTSANLWLQDLGKGLKDARIFLDTLTGKFYRKYLAWYLKIEVWDGANNLKYISFMINMMLWNVLSLVELHGLDMSGGWKKVILQRKSFVSNQEEMEIGKADHSWGDVMSYRRMSHGLGAEIGELMRGKDKSGGRWLRRSCCIFMTQANE